MAFFSNLPQYDNTTVNFQKIIFFISTLYDSNMNINITNELSNIDNLTDID